MTIYEYDLFDDCDVPIEVDDADYAACETDAEAAYRIALQIEEQRPELLEIIAKYMAIADDLGHADARAWLIDYFEEDDQKYHPYA